MSVTTPVSSTAPPSPALFMETVSGYQRTAAIKAAIELRVFAAIGSAGAEVSEIATTCAASERGIRILCDYLAVLGFLVKGGQRYSLTPDSALFLDDNSPAYLGGTIEFLLSPTIVSPFEQSTEFVRRGTTVLEEGGTLAPDHPAWVDFARAMMPLMAMPAQLLAQLIRANTPLQNRGTLKVLDIAAGHGAFGIAIAQNFPQAQITGLDWASVLAVAEEHARAAGVGERYRSLAGSVFDVKLDTDFDLVLLPNFLHHFDETTIVELLKKVHASLTEGGQVAVLEFIPNADRISPPGPVAFSFTMLATTPHGDAYTFDQLEAMLKTAGFTRSERHELPPSLQRVVLAAR